LLACRPTAGLPPSKRTDSFTEQRLVGAPLGSSSVTASGLPSQFVSSSWRTTFSPLASNTNTKFGFAHLPRASAWIVFTSFEKYSQTSIDGLPLLFLVSLSRRTI